MATVIRHRNKWRAQVRRKVHAPQTQTFKNKAQAQQWSRILESEQDAGRAKHQAKPAPTVAELVDRYDREVGDAKPFGRNKADVLKRIRHHLGSEPADQLTPGRIVSYIKDDRKIRDVTASIDLTYLKGVLKIAKALWRENVQPANVDDAREIMRYMGSLHRGAMRDRRPTQDELDSLRQWFQRSVGSAAPYHSNPDPAGTAEGMIGGGMPEMADAINASIFSSTSAANMAAVTLVVICSFG